MLPSVSFKALMRWRAKILGKVLVSYHYKARHIDFPHLFCYLLKCVFYVSSKAEKESGMTLSERGSVLVFLPGIHEISYMQEALAKLVHKR